MSCGGATRDVNERAMAFPMRSLMPVILVEAAPTAPDACSTLAVPEAENGVGADLSVPSSGAASTAIIRRARTTAGADLIRSAHPMEPEDEAVGMRVVVPRRGTRRRSSACLMRSPSSRRRWRWGC